MHNSNVGIHDRNVVFLRQTCSVLGLRIFCGVRDEILLALAVAQSSVFEPLLELLGDINIPALYVLLCLR